jgi:tetratricopeptide (TPR) repeat protein
VPAEEEEVPAWLRILREEGLEEPTLEEAPTEEVVAEAEVAPVEEAAPVEEEEEEKEIPAWLRILREEELEELTLEEALPAEEVLAGVEVPEAEAALVEEAAPVEEEIPPWLRIVREKLEEAPTEEVVAEAVELPEVEEEIPIAAEVVAEEVPEEVVPFKAEPVEVPSTIAECQARLEIEPKDYETRLSLARAYYEEGDREAAFDQYGKLIRSSRLLEMVIEDLEQASREAPDQSTTWQLLGDAYVKAGHLQKALESYQKALAKL